MQQVPILIQSGIGGALNLFELGPDNKYHFVRVVNEIPLNWTYKPPHHPPLPKELIIPRINPIRRQRLCTSSLGDIKTSQFCFTFKTYGL